MESIDHKSVAHLFAKLASLNPTETATVTHFIQTYWLPRWRTAFDFSELLPNLRYVEYPDDFLIYEENSKIDKLLFLVQGVINVYKRSQPLQNLSTNNAPTTRNSQSLSQNLRSPKKTTAGLPGLAEKQVSFSVSESSPYGQFTKQIGSPECIGENIFTCALNRHYTCKSQGVVKCCSIDLSLARKLCSPILQENVEFQKRMAEFLGLSTTAVSKFELYKYLKYKQLPLREKIITQGENRRNKSKLFFILTGEVKMSISVSGTQAADSYSLHSPSVGTKGLAKLNWSYVPSVSRNSSLLNLCRFDFAGAQILFNEEYKYTYSVSTSTATFFEILAKDIEFMPPELFSKIQQAYDSHQAAVAKKFQTQEQLLKKGPDAYTQGRGLEGSLKKKKKNTQQIKELKKLCMHVPRLNPHNDCSIVNNRSSLDEYGQYSAPKNHGASANKHLINSLSTPYLNLVPAKKQRKTPEVKMQRKNWDRYLRLPNLYQ